jgi:hypothetical protein
VNEKRINANAKNETKMASPEVVVINPRPDSEITQNGSTFVSSNQIQPSVDIDSHKEGE